MSEGSRDGNPEAATSHGVAIVTGAGGQDGSLLVENLLDSGWVVHATIRPGGTLGGIHSAARRDDLTVHSMDVTDSSRFRDLVAQVNPDEFYNLAGVSSVSASFAAPWETWRTNADAVVMMLEVLRQHCPSARFYQSSSSEMFGYDPAGTGVHDEDSVLAPVSPYGAAKAAAHTLCQTYRRAFGLRVSCGILFNHESSRRREGFLTRKVVDHVRRLRSARREGASIPPLEIGDPSIMRDWGFAPDFVDGIVRVNRQVAVRGALDGTPEPDVANNYRDYVLGTGVVHSVQQLVDRAFQLAGFELSWLAEGAGGRILGASYASTETPAVIARDELRRPADPRSIRADPSRARRELGWTPNPGLDRFLEEMLSGDDLASARGDATPPR